MASVPCDPLKMKPKWFMHPTMCVPRRRSYGREGSQLPAWEAALLFPCRGKFLGAPFLASPRKWGTRENLLPVLVRAALLLRTVTTKSSLNRTHTDVSLRLFPCVLSSVDSYQLLMVPPEEPGSCLDTHGACAASLPSLTETHLQFSTAFSSWNAVRVNWHHAKTQSTLDGYLWTCMSQSAFLHREARYSLSQAWGTRREPSLLFLHRVLGCWAFPRNRKASCCITLDQLRTHR